MQQHRVPLVERQHVVGVKIPKQNGKKERTLPFAKNNSSSEHIGPATVQTASNAWPSDVMCEDSLALTKKINNQGWRLPSNRVNIV